jgi:sec-independent protein translocase protein TatB
MFPEGRILDFLIIGVLALIVVGPKDLPVLMRKVGQFMAHMRAMAAEFRASFDEMARQSELDDLRKEVEALRSGQTLSSAAGLGELEPDLGVKSVMDDIHKSLKPGEPAPSSVAVGQMVPLETPVEPVAAEVHAPLSPAPDLAAQKDGGSTPVSAAL